MDHQNRKVPFLDPTRAAAFHSRFTSDVRDLVRDLGEQLVPAENHSRFYHGRSWTLKREDGSEATSEIQAYTAEGEIGFKEFIQCRFAALPEQVQAVARKMNDAIAKSLYEQIAKDAAAVGHRISARDKPTTETFLEMLRKIEFSVDRSGRVSRPSIHASPQTAEKLAKDLGSAGLDFETEVAKVIEEKEAEAQNREKERLARYKVRAQ